MCQLIASSSTQHEPKGKAFLTERTAWIQEVDQYRSNCRGSLTLNLQIGSIEGEALVVRQT